MINRIECIPADGLTGRRKIRTPVKEITAANVADVLSAALPIHRQNAAEITYLWDYYRGRQDIRLKEKFVRESINNKLTVNRANEIVTFKTAYLLSEALQYISHGGDDSVSERVNQLNEYMRAEDKESKDKEIVDWMHICGVGERLVLTDAMAGVDDGAPFYIYTLDPRMAFVIYSSGIGEKPLAGVVLQLDEDGKMFATVYTRNRCFVVKDDAVTETGHILGGIPLVEYLNNTARMGSFESVISILNNINLLESNAIDSVEDFVNGFDVFQNCDIEDGTYSELSIGGKAVKIKTVTPGMEAKVYRVASELSQSGVQQRVDDLTDAYLEICGMPNRNGGSSTSDTGTAVLFRDGWSAADARAKDTETMFKRSEREFDRIVLNICSAKGKLDLKLSEFELDFPRGNLSNMQSKVQVLCEMLNNEKIHPKYAFATCGLFDDSEEAYRVSVAYYEEQLRKQEEDLMRGVDNARTEALRNGRQGDSDADQNGTPAGGQGETTSAD